MQRIVASWRPAITWTDIGLPQMRSCGIHLTAFPEKMLYKQIPKMPLKIVNSYWNLENENDLYFATVD